MQARFGAGDDVVISRRHTQALPQFFCRADGAARIDYYGVSCFEVAEATTRRVYHALRYYACVKATLMSRLLPFYRCTAATFIATLV